MDASVHRRIKGITGVGLASLSALLILSSAADVDPTLRRLDEDVLDQNDDNIFQQIDELNVEDPYMDDTLDDDDDGRTTSAFAIGLLSAILIKLTSSIDDIVWLVPYLIVPDRAKVIANTFIYLWVCLAQTVLALSISHGGVATLNAVHRSNGGWSSERILTLFAGLCMFLYGCKLAHEYYHEVWLGEGEEEDNDEEAEGGDSEGDEGSGLMSGEKVEGYSGGDTPTDPTATSATSKANAKARTSSSLFVVAFLGSLDDLSLFVPMLLGQAITWVELMVGATIAATAIVLLCRCLGLCRPVAKCLEAIPLAAIVLTFGTYLTVKASLMK